MATSLDNLINLEYRPLRFSFSHSHIIVVDSVANKLTFPVDAKFSTTIKGVVSNDNTILV